MKKVLYGFLFFLIGIGYFLLSWVSCTMIWVQPLLIIPIDIFLIFLAYKTYFKLDAKFKEEYQKVLLLLLILLMPVLINISVVCIGIYFNLYDTSSNKLEDSVLGILLSAFGFKSLILSSILLFICNLRDPLIKETITDSQDDQNEE